MASGIRLGRYFEEYISSLVASGRFKSRNEGLREAVRLVQQREKRFAALDPTPRRKKGRARQLASAKA